MFFDNVKDYQQCLEYQVYTDPVRVVDVCFCAGIWVFVSVFVYFVFGLWGVLVYQVVFVLFDMFIGYIKFLVGVLCVFCWLVVYGDYLIWFGYDQIEFQCFGIDVFYVFQFGDVGVYFFNVGVGLVELY